MSNAGTCLALVLAFALLPGCAGPATTYQIGLKVTCCPTTTEQAKVYLLVGGTTPPTGLLMANVTYSCSSSDPGQTLFHLKRPLQASDYQPTGASGGVAWIDLGQGLPKHGTYAIEGTFQPTGGSAHALTSRLTLVGDADPCIHYPQNG